MEELQKTIDDYEVILSNPDIYYKSYVDYNDGDESKFFKILKCRFIQYCKSNPRFREEILKGISPVNAETNKGCMFSPKSSTSHLRDSSLIGFRSMSSPIVT